MGSRPLFLSLTLHLTGVLTLWALLHSLGPEVAGSSGLRGSPYAGLLVVVTSPGRAAREPRRVKTFSQGIPVAKAQPLEAPREEIISQDRVTQVQSSAVPREDAPAGEDPGPLGQGGFSNRLAERIGNGSRTNELGLYLGRVADRIQRHLRSPGMLEARRTAEIQILILPSGKVNEIRMKRSSGDRRLDLLALDAIQRAQPFEPTATPLRANIPIVFNVKGF